MTTQDADDSDTESSAADDQNGEAVADDSAPVGAESDEATTESEENDVEPTESVTEFLSELAEAPEDDIDAVLEDILADGREPATADAGEENGESDTVTGAGIDTDDVTVSDELVAELESMPTEQLARTLAVLRAEISNLETKLAETEERAEDLESRLARKQADFQNYKKRQKKRLQDEKERATEDFVERLLDVRDNLARALEQDEDADIRGGVESTLEQFDQQLERENVERIEPEIGGETDPRRHEVLATIASDQPEDTIAQVHRPGYLMGEKVLRPAQVAVSDGSLEEDEE